MNFLWEPIFLHINNVALEKSAETKKGYFQLLHLGQNSVSIIWVHIRKSF